MQTLLSDIRYALRRLRKAPGFALTVVLTLALGLGATTAIFTLVYQVLLRSLPVTHPEQLYKLGRGNVPGVYGGLQNDWDLVSTDLYRSLGSAVPHVAAVEAARHIVTVRRAGSQAPGQALREHFASGNYFQVLGAEVYAGRLLTPEDDRVGAAPVAVISYTVWQTKFGADPHIVGATLLLNGRPYTVAGITAPRFVGENLRTDPIGLWLPLASESQFDPEHPLNQSAATSWLTLLVRIPDAREAGAVQSAIRGRTLQWLQANRGLFASDHPDDKRLLRQNVDLVAIPGGISNLRDDYAESLKLLLAVAGFILLIACANLANLMLARGMARRQELAVRAALGAPRGRLLRQTLVESVLLSLAGGAAAIVVAYAGTRAILAFALRDAQVSPLSAAPSWPVLGFALALSLVTGLLFGIIPARVGARADPIEALRGANRSAGDASSLPQRALVMVQAALSLAMLSTAALLITSLGRLQHQDFGFQAQGRIVVSTNLAGAGYTYAQLDGLYRRFDDAFARLPGIASFAYATYSPMEDATVNGGVYRLGEGTRSGVPLSAGLLSVSPGYFETLGTRIVAGRGITDRDTAAGAHVAVVNRNLAERLFPGQRVLGQHFGPDQARADEFEVVGVAEDAKYGHPARPATPMYFTPMAQSTVSPSADAQAEDQGKHFAGNLVFRYRGDPSAASAQIRRALAEVNPEIPVIEIGPYTDQVSGQFTQEELVARLTGLFGLTALVLASLGLYGVTAYAVTRRTPEIGIRMALGASRAGVLLMVVRGALRHTAYGLLLGIPLAWAAARLVASGLYETPAFQPLLLAAVAAVLLLAALAAALVPARRAASIDPMIALRSE